MSANSSKMILVQAAPGRLPLMQADIALQQGCGSRNVQTKIRLKKNRLNPISATRTLPSACFSPRTDVLTFFGLIPHQTSNLSLKTFKIITRPTGCIRE
jgi:hypothetical protein